MRYLPQNDRSYHHNDDHYHCNDQPGSPVFLASRVLSCLKCLIPCASLCGPSCLLLLSGFLRLCHFLLLFPVRCGALQNGGAILSYRYMPILRSSGSMEIRMNSYHYLVETLLLLSQATVRSAGRPQASSATAQSRPLRGLDLERCPDAEHPNAAEDGHQADQRVHLAASL